MQGVILKIDKRPEETVDAYKVRLLQLAASGRLDAAIRNYNREYEQGKKLYHDATSGQRRR